MKATEQYFPMHGAVCFPELLFLQRKAGILYSLEHGALKMAKFEALLRVKRLTFSDCKSEGVSI